MAELLDSYGNVTGEYAALRDHAGVVRNLHELVWVRGVDAVSFLDGILSQDVAEARPGDVVRSFLLQPNGKLEALAWLLVGTEEVGLLVDDGLGEQVGNVLGRYRIRVKAVIEREERPLTEVWGKGASGALSAAGLPVPEGWSNTDDGLVAHVPLGSLPRYIVVGAEVGGTAAGALAARAIRVEAGEPVMNRDVSSSTIPQETGLVPSAVSFSKGCYVGQELVARIDTRGHVNRRLVGVVIEHNVVPPDGAKLVAGGKEVGTLTSPAESLTLRAPIGLALVRREVEAGDQVSVEWSGGSTSARVLDVPLSSFDET